MNGYVLGHTPSSVTPHPDARRNMSVGKCITFDVPTPCSQPSRPSIRGALPPSMDGGLLGARLNPRIQAARGDPRSGLFSFEGDCWSRSRATSSRPLRERKTASANRGRHRAAFPPSQSLPEPAEADIVQGVSLGGEGWGEGGLPVSAAARHATASFLALPLSAGALCHHLEPVQGGVPQAEAQDHRAIGGKLRACSRTPHNRCLHLIALDRRAVFQAKTVTLRP